MFAPISKSRLAGAIAIFGAIFFASQQTQAKAPPIEDIVNCKFDAERWQDFRLMLGATGKEKAPPGWAIVPSPNHDLVIYTVPAPIAVYGFNTDQIAVSDEGIYALIAGAEPEVLAKELGIASDAWAGYSVASPPDAQGVQTVGLDDVGGSYIGTSTAYVRTVIDKATGLWFEGRAVFTMFDRNSHSGISFVGCRYIYYRSDQQDGASDAVSATAIP